MFANQEGRIICYCFPRISRNVLIRPFVDASWDVTFCVPASSGSIFFASCFPSSTPHWSKLKMFQITPWVKILCSYIAMRLPRDRGVIFFRSIELVGRFPGNTLNGSRVCISPSLIPEAFSSFSTSSAPLPFISASVCAKKFASSFS